MPSPVDDHLLILRGVINYVFVDGLTPKVMCDRNVNDRSEGVDLKPTFRVAFGGSSSTTLGFLQKYDSNPWIAVEQLGHTPRWRCV